MQTLIENMNLEQAAYVAEILAALGVVVSLIYVAREISQNNDLLESQARASRASSRLQILERSIDNPEISRVIAKAVDAEKLTHQEEVLLANVQGYILTEWQYVYGEFQAGLIEDDDLPIDGWRVVYKGSHYTPSMSETWRRTGKIAYRPDFYRWMEENIVN